MITEVQLLALLVVMLIVSAVLLLIAGVTMPLGILAPLTNLPTVVLLLLWAFNRWLWRTRWLHPWLVQTPDLQGTWKGTFDSDYIAPGADPSGSGISGDAYLVIRQTFSTVKVKLITSESRSESLVCRIVHCDDGTDELVAVYEGTPRPSVRDRSEIHFGGFRIRVLGERRPVLEGEYWTSRKTRGELTFRAKNPKPVEDFERARQLDFTDQ